MNRASSTRSKNLFPFLALVVFLVLAAVSAFVVFNLYQSKQRYEAEAENSSRNLAIALEHALQAHFLEVDLALRRARQEFRSMHAEQRFTPAAFSGYLSSLRERIPQAHAIRGTDANGMVVYGDDAGPANPQDLKVREFYQRATTERELIFGVPIVSRVSGQMVFPLIYAMTYPDGRFGGTAYVNMNTSRITELIAALKLGKHGVITLIDTQRRLIHRYPEKEGTITGKPVTIAAETASVLASGARNRSYMATSAIDGERRSYSIERIGAYPVYILVGLSERDYLAPWNDEVRNGASFLLVLFLMSASLLAGVRASLTRQQAAMRQLVEQEAVLQSSLQARTESEARFRSLTEGLPQMVWTTRGELVFDFISHHWLDYTGMSAQDLARPDALASLVHPDDGARMREAWTAALAAGDQFRCGCRLRRHDGAWRVFDNHALPQRGGDGVVLGWVGSSTDITEQSEAHEALLRAKEEALAGGRAKSDFVANMSHEIRSPMNAVLGMLQLLQRTPMGSIQRDYATKAETSARALLGILNDILDFSKVEEGKLALDPHPFSFDKLLRELSVILSANASGKDIEVLFHVSPDLPRWLEGDGMRLQQVLLNLAGNAIKFTEHGEVLLSVSRLASSEDSVEVAFSVRDTGIGIAPEHMPHIFDGFSQAEASTTRRYGGSGLGLAISRNLVALMGGTLRASSVPGKGSEFSFTVTFGRTAQQGERVLSHVLQHLQCLIVDDNATGREVLGEIVHSFGWRATAVDSGASALEAIAGRRYDVVFMDWRMPGMDGWEASKRIRKLLPQDAQPLIIMTTAHDRDFVAENDGSILAVLDAMLTKPLTASVVFDTVSDLRLGLRQPARDLHSAAARAIASQGTLTGLRVLVVDDNAMNQQVARELLGAAGAAIEVADSGQAAIDKVCADAAFDLILMDIQMPDMDGYAATAHILRRLGDAAPPIVAMTANAMASDREAAISAGMADHVGKPFDLDQLIVVILRHARPARDSASAEPARPASGELNQDAALARMGNNMAAYQLALRGFQGELDKLTRELSEAMRDDAPKAAGAALHVMQGLAGMIGADRLADLAREAQARLHETPASWAGVAPVLAEAARAIGAANAAVEPALAGRLSAPQGTAR